MNYLSDVLYVNKEALRMTIPKLKHVPLLTGAYVVYQLLQFFVSLLGAQMGSGIGFIWGFVVYLVNIAIMAHFLSLLHNVVRYNRLKPADLTSQEFTRLMPALIQAFFILYLIELVFGMVLSPMLPGILSTIILLLWSGAKMPVQESVYLGNQYGMSALMATLQFWKDNWMQWSAVIVVALLFNIFVQPMIALLSFGSIWLAPIVWIVTGLCITTWMIWRGELFDILHGSSLRSRTYKREHYR